MQVLYIRAIRRAVRLGVRWLWKAGRTPVARVVDRTIPGPDGALPVRVYTPEGSGPFPLLVVFHGSGFVICDLDTHDPLCRDLCARASSVVVSVDYRLAPEHRFPAASDDCLAATRWAAEHAAELRADPERIAVVGDSAGGNLAAVTALRLRDEGGPTLRAQVLVYPVTDYHTPPTPSYLENAKGRGLTRGVMIWFWKQYLADASEADDPRAAPLRAPELRGLPPALVITAEYDVLRDEGERYAGRLEEAGVPAELTRYAGLRHGFVGLAGPTADHGRALDQICVWLKDRWTAAS